MRIGRLRDKITVQEETETLDSGGFDQTSVKTDICTVWGCIEPVSAREQWEADQKRPRGTHRITIRNRTDVRSKYTITATIQGQTRNWQIQGIRHMPEERHIWLEMLCLELPGL